MFVQDEIFTHPHSAEFRVSAETGLVQKLYLDRSPWAGDGCFGSVGNSSWCLLAGVRGGAAALPAGAHPPGGLSGEAFLQQPTHRAAGEPPGRGESPASVLQEAARALGACVMTLSELSKHSGANRGMAALGQRTPPERLLHCSGWAGSGHLPVLPGPQHSCIMNGSEGSSRSQTMAVLLQGCCPVQVKLW